MWVIHFLQELVTVYCMYMAKEEKFHRKEKKKPKKAKSA